MNDTRLRSLDTDVYVDYRLSVWADWCNKCIVGGLGYHSRTILSLMVDYGGVRIQTSSMASKEISNDNCEEVDSAIIALNEYRPQLAKILLIRYLSPKKVKEKLAVNKIPYNTYKRGLQMAKAWMAAALCVGNKNRNLL